MISDKMLNALNEQINAEVYSAYLYFAMSSHCKSINLNGFAHWTYVQAQEEMTHALKLYNYVNDRGGKAIMKAIKAPESEWASPLEMAEHIYKHEQLVTSLINNLATMAKDEKDHATDVYLQWFVEEQVEEEASADEIVNKLKLMGTDGPGLFMLDQELAQRVFTMPVWLQGKG